MQLVFADLPTDNRTLSRAAFNRTSRPIDSLRETLDISPESNQNSPQEEHPSRSIYSLGFGIIACIKTHPILPPLSGIT